MIKLFLTRHREAQEPRVDWPEPDKAMIPGAKPVRCLLTSLILSLTATASVAEDERFSFPARAADLPAGVFFWIGGPHAGGNQAPKDAGAARYDEDAAEWLRTDGPSTQHENHLAYGLPLYAPVSGEIVTCWRNSPESILPADNPDFPGQFTSAGNHVNILTDHGSIVLVAHLLPGTLPEDLCPNEGDLLPVGFPRTGPYPSAYVLDPATRPRVRRGQFIGRLGDSGNSSAPHLHYHLKDAEGDFETVFGESTAREYPLSYAWVQTTSFSTPLDPDAWVPAAQAAHHAAPRLLVWPDPLLRRQHVDLADGAEREMVSHLDLLVEAYANEDGDLRVASHQVGQDGLTELDEVTGGAASQTRIAQVGVSHDFVVGVQAANGRLKLIAVDMTASGALDRQGEFNGHPITHLKMASLASAGFNNGFITATRSPDGTLLLDSWTASGLGDGGAEIEISHRDQIVAGTSATFDVTALNHGRMLGETDAFRGAIVAMRNSDGDLHLRAFALNGDLEFSPAGDADGGAVGKIDLETVRLDAQRKGVVTAIQTNDQRLKMISYAVSAKGELVRVDEESAGQVTHLSLAQADQRHLVTALRTGGGSLRVITWAIGEDGKLNRVGTVRGGATSGVSVSSTFAGARRYILTAARLSSGTWRTIMWEANLR